MRAIKLSWILLLLPLLGLIIVRFFFDFNGLYGQDAHRYFQFVGELEAYLNDGKSLGEFHWPIFYPLSGLCLKWIIGCKADLALQIVSSLSLGVSGFFLHKILAGKSARAWVFTLIFFIICPQLLVGSVINMSDMYSMMWVTLCWYSWFRFRQNGHGRWGFWMTLFGAFATISRYPAFLLVMLPLIHTFVNLLKEKDLKALLMPVIFMVGLLPELLLHPTFQSVSGSYQLNHWSLVNWFKSYFETNDGVQNYRFINLVYVTYPFWHPAYFLAGIGLMIIAWLRFGFAKIHWVIPMSILVYLLFIGGIEFQNRRFFILVFPLLMIMFYQTGFYLALKSISRKALITMASLLVVVQLGISAYYLKPYLEINQFERQLAENLQAYQGKKLYAFYWDLALQSYNLQFEYFNLWQEPIDKVKSGDLVLFNPDDLEQQWQGTTVMENWQKLSREEELLLIEKWENGWQLYEVK